MSNAFYKKNLSYISLLILVSRTQTHCALSSGASYHKGVQAKMLTKATELLATSTPYAHLHYSEMGYMIRGQSCYWE